MMKVVFTDACCPPPEQTTERPGSHLETASAFERRVSVLEMFTTFERVPYRIAPRREGDLAALN